MPSWKPMQPYCSKCKSRHWQSLDCHFKPDDPPKAQPLCPHCHDFHPPENTCNAFKVIERQKIEDQRRVDAEAEEREREFEASRRKRKE